jgi:hypothetical protein
MTQKKAINSVLMDRSLNDDSSDKDTFNLTVVKTGYLLICLLKQVRMKIVIILGLPGPSFLAGLFSCFVFMTTLLIVALSCS